MKRRSLSTMTPPELIAEIAKLEGKIKLLSDTRDDMELTQLAAARALKFACECQMRGRKLSPAPAPEITNVVSLAEYRLKRALKHA